ncbi:hypothetical protein ACP4OV_027580 [Aristida adscensionis]
MNTMNKVQLIRSLGHLPPRLERLSPSRQLYGYW